MNIKRDNYLVDHPVLEVVAECHDAHLVDHMQVPGAVEVQDGVERPNSVFVNKLKLNNMGSTSWNCQKFELQNLSAMGYATLNSPMLRVGFLLA